MTNNQVSIKFVLCVCLLFVGAISPMSFVGRYNKFETVTKPSTSKSAVQDVPSIAPVDFKVVTKVRLYGETIDSETKKIAKHMGIDFEMAEGSNVFATADGVVVLANNGENYGNVIRIRHGKAYSTVYAHLKISKVKQGDQITKGQVIGLVGNTGSSKAPHLHYEILKDGEMVDPKDYLPKLPLVF